MVLTGREHGSESAVSKLVSYLPFIEKRFALPPCFLQCDNTIRASFLLQSQLICIAFFLILNIRLCSRVMLDGLLSAFFLPRNSVLRVSPFTSPRTDERTARLPNAGIADPQTWPTPALSELPEVLAHLYDRHLSYQAHGTQRAGKQTAWGT